MTQVRFFGDEELVLCIRQLKLKIPWDLEMKFSELEKPLGVSMCKKLLFLSEYIKLWYLKLFFLFLLKYIFLISNYPIFKISIRKSIFQLFIIIKILIIRIKLISFLVSIFSCLMNFNSIQKDHYWIPKNRRYKLLKFLVRLRKSFRNKDSSELVCCKSKIRHCQSPNTIYIIETIDYLRRVLLKPAIQRY